METGFRQYDGCWQDNAQLAWDAVALRPARGIATWQVLVMDIPLIERLGGHASGDYRRDPHTVYLDFQRAIGACFIDQYLAENPLTMTDRGYASSTARTATTGLEAAQIVLDGIPIDSPEAVAEHLERFVWPDLRRQIAELDATPIDSAAAKLVAGEVAMQERFGLNMLKVPYDGWFGAFPKLRYYRYGYANYFMAYALFPELMERDFALQADLAARQTAIAARAIVAGGLPRIVRLDHDMADGRGTLVDIRSLGAIWFPHFARSIKPLLDAGVRLIWHCDGNLMAMVPRLIEAGVGGFQGFQYEFGMDYPAICRMKTRDGGPLAIWAGSSVTTSLPLGTPDDVARELDWLVENGPAEGLVLGASSSVVPGTPHANIERLIEGLHYYRQRGRK